MTNASGAARCGAVIDRHVPKTGGTTVRTFLRHNAKLGSCHYAGYDVSSTWKSRVGFNHVDFREIARDLAKGGRLWCVEAHVVADTFWHDLGVLRSTLSQAPSTPPCTVVTLVRVREPYAWYKSYYSWAILERQRGGMPSATWGANFTDWLPYNLQSQHLLVGDRVSAGSKHGVALSRRPRRRDPRRLSEEQWAGVRRVLAAADVTIPLERLDEALVLVAHLVPFLRSTLYRTHAPGPMRGAWDKVRPRLAVPDLHAFCAPGEAERACRAAVEAVALDDRRLYAMVSANFAKQLAAAQADPAYPQRLNDHRAGVRAIATWEDD